MQFKLWLLQTENMAGPGGGPDWIATDQVRLNKEIASKGAGAFPTGGDNPPKPKKASPTKAYERKKPGSTTPPLKRAGLVIPSLTDL